VTLIEGGGGPMGRPTGPSAELPEDQGHGDGVWLA
jgi:hypothetical protein